MAGRVEDVQMTPPAMQPQRPRRRKRPGKIRHAAAVSTASDPFRPSDGQALGRIVHALREWRRDEARERSVPPFVVMHDRTLEAIASNLPRSLDELSEVPGIGPAKLSAYGEAILSIVAAVVPSQS
jgi:superfamily II DNA helicase RecQ